MSKNYEITIDAHPNFYNDNLERKLNVCFSEPEEGTNMETGILVLIPGFGGNANSNVYKKMRKQFSDQFNLITIQCDYFGSEFMQSELLEESKQSFNDMGPLQAIDIISSVIIVQEILRDNDLVYNSNKVIAYGHSHGAYLAYLANVFAQDLFSLIIDNSSWLLPVYLQSNRHLYMADKTLVFDYFVKRMEDFDIEIYDLRRHYKKIENKCLIHSFHGDNDNLISLREKEKFINPLKKSHLHKITMETIDDTFRSNSHGLDADFMKMFEYVINDIKPPFKKTKKLVNEKFRIETSTFSYVFDYKNKIPILTREKK
ncbi:DUF2920 family protein [Acetobacterium wieringae]|uniref:DUF2920 family protein n=1 Tax=Acetobacterium wieringae TaxID=52694 RepID=UPI002B202B3B|nr:DUF2920 family protein [Acetobacterium wieringae]MEA4804366.1 DUF2920 family protein [Acetobacterium wieringae]